MKSELVEAKKEKKLALEHLEIFAKENSRLLAVEANLTELKCDSQKMRLESEEKIRELLATGERQSSDRLAMEIRLKMRIEELNKNLKLKER